MSVLFSFVRSVFTGGILFLLYLFYNANFSINSEGHRQHLEVVRAMHKWLDATTDLSQKHFQPCKTCGYELALSHDNFYCLKSDLFKLLHPETLLNDTMVLRDYGGKDLARLLIGQSMYDALPGLVQSKAQEYGYYTQPLENSVIYTYAKNVLRTHTLGKQIGCVFQKYFHVPGQEELALKSNQSTHFHNYISKLKSQNKSQACIDEASYEKPTFRMWKKDECQKFFDTINSKAYKEIFETEGIQYIFKSNKHLGNGILILDPENELTIRKWYQNGAACGQNSTAVIVQEYLKNPYLYNGRKMEFRCYFQIASTNPPILYGYKKALIKQCAHPFSLHDFTKETHVCNSAITKTMKNDEELFIDWNFEELEELLLTQGRIKQKNWIQEYLYPQIMKKMTHLYFSVDQYLFKDSRVGEFFGVDFILDNDLRLWIFECNRNPNFLAATEGRKEKFGKLIPNMLEIQMQLIRSRFVRLQKFVKEKLLPLVRRKQNISTDKNLQHEFLLLMRDQFEEGYELSKENEAMLAYVGDEALAKKMNYSNFVNKECLDN